MGVDFEATLIYGINVTNACDEDDEGDEYEFDVGIYIEQIYTYDCTYSYLTHSDVVFYSGSYKCNQIISIPNDLSSINKYLKIACEKMGVKFEPKWHLSANVS